MESSGLIYLVRHCALIHDESNYRVMLGQQIDTGLSELGQQQAQCLAAYFASKGIEAIYTSPLSRTLQTARIIGNRLNIGLNLCSSLNEIDVGRWEGLTNIECQRSDPVRYASLLHDPSTYGFPGGENISEACRRVVPCLEKLAAKHSRGRIVVVAHPLVNRAALTHLMGLPMTRVREIDQDPGCVNVIRVFRGVMELQAVNYTDNFVTMEDGNVPFV